MINEAIKVKNLEKKFGRKVVLQGLDFNIPMDSIAGFLGPNGAGKTTTLRILMGLIPSYSGEISMLNCSLPSQRTAACERIGAVVENPTFIETMSAFNNLQWFGSLYKPLSSERIHEVIDLVGLKEATFQSFGTFSSGMKQRLGVAFGILHKPKLLILDEPTSGMDPAGRVHMREILKKIHAEEKTTIFLSSHLLDEVQRLCNYVVIIDKGVTITEGFVEDLLASSREKWEIRMNPDQAGKCREVLATIPELDAEIEFTSRGCLLTMVAGHSARVNELLVKNGMEVSALIPLEASLEETFIRLTAKDHQRGARDA